MPDKGDIAGVRITGPAEHAAMIAGIIEAAPGLSVIKHQETPLSNRAVPGLRVHLTVLRGYPPVSRIHAWLAANGWEKLDEGPAGVLWHKPHIGGVGVPHQHLTDDGYTRGALERIAAIEAMTVPELVAAIHVGQEGRE